jgi:hypothetical protein
LMKVSTLIIRIKNNGFKGFERLLQDTRYRTPFVSKLKN